MSIKLPTYKFRVDGYFLRCYAYDHETDLWLMKNDEKIVKLVDASELELILKQMQEGRNGTDRRE